MTAWTSDAFAPPGSGEFARWGLAGAVVLAAHALAFYFLHDIRPAEPPAPAALEQSMEVELAPLEISAAESVDSEDLPAEAPLLETLQAAKPPSGLAPTTAETLNAAEPDQLAAAQPDMLETVRPQPEAPAPTGQETLQTAQPETLAAAEPEPALPSPEALQPQTPEPPQTTEPIQPPEAQPAEAVAAAPLQTAPAEVLAPEETVTSVPSVTAEAVLPEALPALPETRPVAEQPRPAVRRPQQPMREQPRPRREQARAPERRTPAQQDARPRREAAQPPARSRASQASSAVRAAKAPTVSPAKWQSQVQSRVAGSLRRLRGRGFSGRVSVRFTVSASGAITGARIARSSGNSAVDRVAVGAVAGVSVPPPPPGVGRTLTIPVTFN